jgi:hypothetical protein
MTNSMEDRIVREKYDAKMKLLALKLLEEQIAEDERIQTAADDIPVPDYVERSFRNALAEIRREEKRERRSVRVRRVRRLTACVAALAVVVGIVSAAFDVPVAATLSRVFSFLFTAGEDYDRITPTGVDSTARTVGERRDHYFPEYIPDGYELESEEFNKNSIYTSFANQRRDIIWIEQRNAGGSSVMLDNEGTGSGKTSVNGETAFWSENDGGLTLYCVHDGVGIMINSDKETLDVLISIAESLKYKKE